MTSPATLESYRVLIIDDNLSIHEDFRKVLGRASPAGALLQEAMGALFGDASPAPAPAAFQIDCAAQGQEGLALVQKALAEGRPYSVAFVDGRMPPGWDGIETISHLWRDCPELQVVLCTAYADYSWDDIRRILGETDNLVILKKPFDNVEVIQLAHALAKKWELNRLVQGRLADLDRLVLERTEQVQQAHTLFEASLAQSPAGILIAEAPGATIRWANHAALGIRGSSSLPLTGIDFTRHSAHWQTFRADGSPYPSEEWPLSRAVLQGETTRNEELVIRNADGQNRWVSANAAPIRKPDGTITAGIVIFQEITERKRAEQEKERLQTQLIQAQKMESVGRLAGGVAHDFNNMLQCILGNTALALEDVPSESPLRASLEEIEKAARRSAGLTRQLLAFARKQTIAPKVLDLNDSLAGMLKMLRALIGEDIELAWRPGAGLWPVNVDPSQIDQILANLCVNARDAIEGVGAVTIETANAAFDEADAASHLERAPGDYVMLAVSDTGQGMDAATRAHLFEPFFTTKPLGKGTGLGLAMVFGIVKQNHGFVSVQSEPGQGAVFKVYLPRAKSGVVPVEQKPAPVSLRGTETVLLVEDEDQVLILARRILERLGYTVLVAGTPEAALVVAARHNGPVDLLITDVVMPGMTGKQLRDQLRQSQPDLICLFMSGYTADVIAHHGVLDEGVEFLQKPFSVQSLAENVRRLLEPRREPPNS